MAGEITANAKIDIEKTVRETLKQVGYDDEKTTMDYRTCEIEQYIKKQIYFLFHIENYNIELSF